MKNVITNIANCLLNLVAAAGALAAPPGNAARPIDFNETIRPILVERCIACHGGVKQAGDFSFVYPEMVLPPGGSVIEPGEPEHSELIARVRSQDPDLQMPPPGEHGQQLTQTEIEQLEQWILEGASWGEHWSLAPLAEPKYPSHINSSWARNGIDAYVMASLESANLQPSKSARPAEWLRRASFDLTGLPPSSQEIDSLDAACKQASTSEDLDAIYAATVDRLLASERFGERWASLWMDLSRYADSQGFEKDPHRDIWPYRDWLIHAFNQDMPYDLFTIKQLAGDLLSSPNTNDLIATAFHRNTQTNTEGGTDDEEFRVAAVIDRVSTTWTVWQATTMGCVQCHAHPYDAYRHEDFYASLALFNSSEDADLNSDFPTLRLPNDPAQWESAVKLQRELLELELHRNDLGSLLAQAVSWQPLTPLVASSSHGQIAASENEVKTTGGTFPIGTVFTLETPSTAMTAMKLTILPSSDDPQQLPEQGAIVTFVELIVIDAEGNERKLELQDAFADYLAGPYSPQDCLKSDNRGFGGYPKLLGPRWVTVVLREPLMAEENGTLRIRLEQKGEVAGSLATHLKHIRLELCNTPQWNELLDSTELVHMSQAISAAKIQLDETPGIQLPIIDQRDPRGARPTRMFIRGNWLERGEEIAAGLPAIFSSREGTTTVENRLQFAQWLVSDANPLAARVWANRVWATLFGSGIVETLEDFGSSGTPPSHPALLDYLAWRLRHTHAWHLKPLLREIVLSSTYRQCHTASAELLLRDPHNRLLGRGPRTRLSAEMIRDAALTISGLLAQDVGGSSVMPPQPEGIWQTVYNGEQWKEATGNDRYRRGLYTYWKRTSPYPGFLTFDAPTRDLCSPRRIDTNTPLQALVTLNDVVYQECAQALAKRALLETGVVEEAIGYMLSQLGTPTEVRPLIQSELQSLYDDVTSELAKMHTAGEGSEAAVSTDAQNSGTEPTLTLELRALTVVASAILNSDLMLTK